MRITELLATKTPVFSFEFFPPRSEDAIAGLLQVAEELRALRPAFVSVTYGAGGSTRARTIDLCKRISGDVGLNVMMHLTCVGSSRDELREILDDLQTTGIENILALRGDPPRGSEHFETPPGGFAHADELVAMIDSDYEFSVGGACYPEKHPEAPDFETDLANLRRKVEAGARFLITQLFFDNDKYFAFVDAARRNGVGVPIIPGVMPITNYEQIQRFTAMCGSTIPAALRAELEERRDDPKAVEDLGVAFAALQCADLLARGAPGIHFYTLNKSPATRAIVSSLTAAAAWRGVAIAP